MDKDYTIFDTTVIGAVFTLCFILGLHFVANPACFDQKIDTLLTTFSLKDDLTGKLLVIGIIAHVLGAIIRVVSIRIFRRRGHRDDEARKCIATKILAAIKEYNDSSEGHSNPVCPGAYRAINDADPDSIFAWVHYSDPRSELIEWGRRKMHYVYLAENWIIGIWVGYVAGVFVGFTIYRKEISTESLGYSLFWLIATVVPLLFCNKELSAWKKQNEDYNKGMIAMYVTGRVWKGLEGTFLPKKTEEGKP